MYFQDLLRPRGRCGSSGERAGGSYLSHSSLFIVETSASFLLFSAVAEALYKSPLRSCTSSRAFTGKSAENFIAAGTFLGAWCSSNERAGGQQEPSNHALEDVNQPSRIRREPGATGRERHWIVDASPDDQRETAGDSQGGAAQGLPGSLLRDLDLGRQCAGPQRDRAGRGGAGGAAPVPRRPGSQGFRDRVPGCRQGAGRGGPYARVGRRFSVLAERRLQSWR